MSNRVELDVMTRYTVEQVAHVLVDVFQQGVSMEMLETWHQVGTLSASLVAEYTVDSGLSVHLLRHVVPAVSAWVPLYVEYMGVGLEKLRKLKESAPKEKWFTADTWSVKQVMMAPYFRLRRYGQLCANLCLVMEGAAYEQVWEANRAFQELEARVRPMFSEMLG